MPDQTEASPKGNQPAGEPLGGVGEEHHAQHPGGENEHHRPAIEQQQPQAGSLPVRTEGSSRNAATA